MHPKLLSTYTNINGRERKRNGGFPPEDALQGLKRVNAVKGWTQPFSNFGYEFINPSPEILLGIIYNVKTRATNGMEYRASLNKPALLLLWTPIHNELECKGVKNLNSIRFQLFFFFFFHFEILTVNLNQIFRQVSSYKWIWIW